MVTASPGGRFSGFESAIRRIVKRRLEAGGREFERKMQSRLRGPTGPGSLRTRTGALRRSLRHQVDDMGSHMVLENFIGGGPVHYARIHEMGGTITPKKSQYLAIPLGPVQQGSGASRVTSPRNDGILVPMRLAGRLFLVRVVGKGARARIEFRWLLVRQVQMPARLGFIATWKEEAPKVMAGIKQDLTALLAKGGGNG